MEPSIKCFEKIEQKKYFFSQNLKFKNKMKCKKTKNKTQPTKQRKSLMLTKMN